MLLDRHRVGRVVEVLREATAEHLAAAPVRAHGLRRGDLRDRPLGIDTVLAGEQVDEVLEDDRAVCLAVGLDVKPQIGARVHERPVGALEDRARARLRAPHPRGRRHALVLAPLPPEREGDACHRRRVGGAQIGMDLRADALQHP